MWLRAFYHHHTCSSLVRIPVLTINWRWSSCSPRGSHQPFRLPLKNFRNPPDAVPWLYFSFDEKYCVLFPWAGPVTSSKDGTCKSVRATRIHFLPEVRILLRIKPLCLSKAGEFSSVLEMSEWLQCSVVFLNAFRWCLFHATHLSPLLSSPKENDNAITGVANPE